MDQLLRQYETWECTGDGYPEEWHRPTWTSEQILELESGAGEVVARRVIRPEEKRLAIKDLIREQAGHRCLRCGHPYRAGDPAISERGEWSPCDEQCEHGRVRWNEISERIEAHWRILTVHHLDEDKRNCRWWNLAALCQRCHLRMQRAVVMDRVYSYEHSEWFKPYAAGFYAFKYLRPMIGEAEYLDMGKGLQDLYEAMHEDESPTPTHDRCFRRVEDRELTRDEVMSRLDELLALEHRFTQEAIF